VKVKSRVTTVKGKIKGVFFAMTNNSSVLLYLFRAQIFSNLLGIIYGKKQEPTPSKEHKVVIKGPNLIKIISARN
jgi:hypothetical protein